MIDVVGPAPAKPRLPALQISPFPPSIMRQENYHHHYITTTASQQHRYKSAYLQQQVVVLLLVVGGDLNRWEFSNSPTEKDLPSLSASQSASPATYLNILYLLSPTFTVWLDCHQPPSPLPPPYFEYKRGGYSDLVVTAWPLSTNKH